jgi:hypothetical protein
MFLLFRTDFNSLNPFSPASIRIPEIIRLIDGQTIIYTEYVEDIVQNLSKAVDNAGYTYALYTGYDRSGLTRFLNKKV